jgi:hypothetical protein
LVRGSDRDGFILRAMAHGISWFVTNLSFAAGVLSSTLAVSGIRAQAKPL